MNELVMIEVLEKLTKASLVEHLFSLKIVNLVIVISIKKC